MSKVRSVDRSQRQSKNLLEKFESQTIRELNTSSAASHKSRYDIQRYQDTKVQSSAAQGDKLARTNYQNFKHSSAMSSKRDSKVREEDLAPMKRKLVDNKKS